MTSDPDERTSIASYRQIAANIAGFIVASLAIPMVGFFGHGNDARGYQLTMGLLSMLSVIFFVIAFFYHQGARAARPAAEDLARARIFPISSATVPGWCFFWPRCFISRPS